MRGTPVTTTRTDPLRPSESDAASLLFGRERGKRVLGQHQVAKSFVEHVGIDLSRCEIRMAQESLDGAQVRPSCEKMRRKGMSEPVRVWAIREE